VSILRAAEAHPQKLQVWELILSQELRIAVPRIEVESRITVLRDFHTQEAKPARECEVQLQLVQTLNWSNGPTFARAIATKQAVSLKHFTELCQPIVNALQDTCLHVCKMARFGAGTIWRDSGTTKSR
jgi:hypothetical protein